MLDEKGDEKKMQVDAEEAARIFGMSKGQFNCWRVKAGFPEPVLTVIRANFFDREELEMFAKNNDIQQLVREARYNRNHGLVVIKKRKKKIIPKASQTLMARFIRGEFTCRLGE